MGLTVAGLKRATSGRSHSAFVVLRFAAGLLVAHRMAILYGSRMRRWTGSAVVKAEVVCGERKVDMVL